MNDLSKYQEITELHFDNPNPHLAICHKSQGYSANLRPEALILKSEIPVATTEVIKSLTGIVSEQEILKMLNSNKHKALTEALEVAMKAATNCDYCWIWVQDFSDDMVIFEYESDLYAASYEMGEDGIVIFKGELTKVKRRDMYVESDSGEELVKAADWFSGKHPKVEEEASEAKGEVKGETQTTPKVNEDNEDTMSDTKVDMQEIMKSPEFIDLMKAQRKEWEDEKEVELQKAKLESDTKEILKSFSFVADESVEELTKSLMSQDDAGSVMEILKAANDQLAEKDAKITELEEEVVKTKEEFGKQDSLEGEPKDKTITKSGKKDLSTFVAKNKVSK